MRFLTRLGIGLAVVAILGAIGFEVWVRLSPPVSHGSVTAGLGNGRSCDPTDFGDHHDLSCWEVPFAEGEPVGFGFSLRNTAPIPMTVVRVESYGPPYDLPAHLYPQLIDEEWMYGVDAGRPFEPVEVDPGDELGIQFVGTFRPCETVAGFAEPGIGVGISSAALTLRWGLSTTEIRLPLRILLSLRGPDECPGT